MNDDGRVDQWAICNMEITKKRDRIDGGWDLVAGHMSLSTKSVDGMMKRDGSSSFCMCVSLKIGRGMKMDRWTPQRTMDGSLICQRFSVKLASRELERV